MRLREGDCQLLTGTADCLLFAPDASQTRIRTVQERRQMRTRRTAHGTTTPGLLSKETPHNEYQEVTQDQRI
jgi:hypothetical protein